MKNSEQNLTNKIVNLLCVITILWLFTPQSSANESFDTLHSAIIDEVTTEITLTGDVEATEELGFVGAYDTQKTEFAINGEKFGINGNGHAGIKTQVGKNQKLTINNVGDATVTEGDDGKLSVTVSKSFGGFRLSETPYAGSAVFNQGGTLTINNSVFYDNRVTNGEDYNGGGAISSNNGTVSVDNSVFYQNKSDHAGGAMVVLDGTLTIKDSQFVDNSANTGGGTTDGGGAVFAQNTTTSIEGSTFSGNTAVLGAAVYSGKSDSLTVKDSAFVGNGNSTTTQGGAIQATDVKEVVIENSKFSDNTAQSGGALLIFKSDNADDGMEMNVTIKNTAFENNISTAGTGGAIYASNLKKLSIGEGTTFINNSANSSPGNFGRGGAIYANNIESMEISDGVVFKENKSIESYAGIVHIVNEKIKSSVTIGNNVCFLGNYNISDTGFIIYLAGSVSGTEVRIGDNFRFENNEQNNLSGDLIYFNDIDECYIGKNAQFINNGSNTDNSTFRHQGGVIFARCNSLTLDENAVFKNNTTHGNVGGAINVYANTSPLSIVTIKDGALFENNSVTGNYGGGGAIGNFYGRAYITLGDNITFKNNTSYNGFTASSNGNCGGGAILMFMNEQTLNIGENVLFEGNKAYYNGGAILFGPGNSHGNYTNQNLNIGKNAIFKENKAKYNGGAVGITANGMYVIGEYSTFEGNKANRGGAIYSSGKLYIADNAVFKNNQAVGDGAQGGALWLGQNTLIGDNASFIDNHSDGDGGAVYMNADGSYAYMENATFTGNSAVNGGAIYGLCNGVNLSNSLVTNNSATNGGGLYGVHNTIVDTSFKDNSADNLGGALYNKSGGITYIIAHDKDIIFQGNRDSSGLNDVYMENSGLLLNANQNKNIVFNGTITGSSGAGIIIDHGYNSISKVEYDQETNSMNSPYVSYGDVSTGNIIFNNTVSEISRLEHITGTIILGKNDDQGTIGHLDIKDYKTGTSFFLQRPVLNSANGVLQDMKFEKITVYPNSGLDFILDVDVAEQKADRMVNTAGSTGKVTLANLNITAGAFEDIPEDMTGKDFIIQILKNEDDSDGLQLELSDSVKEQLGNSEYKIGTKNETIVDEITADTKWSDSFEKTEILKDVWGKLGLAKKDTENDSISLNISKVVKVGENVTSQGDTMALVNQDETHSERNFSAENSTDTYKLQENLGSTAEGTFNVSGVAGAGNTTRSTIDMNGNAGFEIDKDNVVINIKDTKIENGQLLVLSTNETSVVNLDNTEITNNGSGIITSGNVNISGDSKIGDNIILTNPEKSININAGENLVVSKTMGGEDGTKLNIENGNVVFDKTAKVTSLDTTLKNTNITLKEETTLNENNVTVVGATALNTTNGKTGDVKFETLDLKGKLKMNVDADLKNQKMDTISAKTANVEEGAGIGVKKINLTSPTTKKSIKILFTDNKDIANAVTYEGKGKVSYSPIYKYKLGYKVEDDMGYFTFNRAGGSNPGVNDYNPTIFASPIATLTAGFLTQSQTLQDGFYHMNTYTKYNKSDRFAAENINRYALNQNTSLDREVAALNFSTKNSGDAGEMIYRKESLPETSHAMWVKPYTSFERVNLRGGIGVNNISYGALYGGDSDMKQLRNGWKGVMSAFIGYTGSYQTYRHNNTITQNGGVIGVTGTLYKGNFFTGLTLSTGASAGEADTMFGTDHFSMLTAGIANKTGYNWELAKGRFIVQPSIFLGYIFANTFDYKNAAGVKMNSDALHAIQIAPGVKFIGNTKKGWQPYLGVDMVWNILGDTKFMANDTRLPELSVKPYVQYGLGLQKTWSDRFTAYFQTMIRNGGRNGVVLQGGFRWAIGK